MSGLKLQSIQLLQAVVSSSTSSQTHLQAKHLYLDILRFTKHLVLYRKVITLQNIFDSL